MYDDSLLYFSQEEVLPYIAKGLNSVGMMEMIGEGVEEEVYQQGPDATSAMPCVLSGQYRTWTPLDRQSYKRTQDIGRQSTCPWHSQDTSIYSLHIPFTQ
jgi:hypothetical protein